MSADSLHKISIVIADDHRLVLEGLVSLLKSVPHIEIVGTAKDGTEVLLLLHEKLADVVLLDISMPKMDGLETCLHISKKFPSVKVIGLSTYDDGKMITQMIKNGASGYVLKNISSKELTQAIEDAIDGKRVLDNKLTDRMINNLQDSISNPASLPPRLTRREKEILELIANELTTNEIADKLFLSSNTILSHRKNLFTKFNVNSSIGLIKKALEFEIIS
jgi:DNA-binding NarL/FixJ family response regulator